MIFAASTLAPSGAREVPFSSEQVISTLVEFGQWVSAADVDGDGDLDVLSASRLDDKVAWYENTDGEGAFGPQQVISTSAASARSVIAADLDRDGDLDLLSASVRDDKIAWYENSDGAGTFGGEQVISTLADGARSVFAADFDGDGDLDVLSASYGDDEIAWYENTDGSGTFGTQQIISSAADFAISVFAADIDGDGDDDVLSTSLYDNKVAWYESNGAGTFGSQQVIRLVDGPYAVFAADVDGDGDVDVLANAIYAGTIVWYENTDGNGTFATQPAISSLASSVRSLFAADVDGDGDLDVATASFDDEIAWYENTDGAGAFGPRQIISTLADGAFGVAVADVDGDGDLDVLSASRGEDKIAWYENETIHRSAAFAQEIVVGTLGDAVRSVFPADIDRDGDLDLLAASGDDDEVAWYENTDGAGTFGAQQVISTDADGAREVVAADVDGDGDLDALSASLFDDEIAWYENIDGAGTFGSQQLITTTADFAFSVVTGDVDGDGDVDALAASGLDDSILWYENDGTGSFDPGVSITELADEARSVFVADLDGDGDLDALSASYADDEIAWYENTDGDGAFGSQQVISSLADGANAVIAADVDGDGDVDVLSASQGDDKVAWYENTDGAGAFDSEQVITTLASGAIALAAADVDADGDLDVVSASRFDDKVAWYENSDGLGTFGPQRLVSTVAADAHSVAAADLDGDGDLDVVSASDDDDKVAWYENLGGQFALATVDVAQRYQAPGQTEDLLAVTAIHNGRAGDSPIELSVLSIRFLSAFDTPLSESDAKSAFESLSIYLDDGSGVLDDADTLVAMVTDYSAITVNGNGVLDVPLVDGDANVRVEFGTPRTFLVAATRPELPPTSSASKLEHRTTNVGTAVQPLTTAEDANADIVLALEFVANVQSSLTDTFLADATCQAPADLNLENTTVQSTLICTAGTVLDAGNGFAVSTPGDVTFRAGQAIHLSDGFSISGDKLTVQVDPDLEP